MMKIADIPELNSTTSSNLGMNAPKNTQHQMAKQKRPTNEFVSYNLHFGITRFFAL